MSDSLSLYILLGIIITYVNMKENVDLKTEDA